MFECFGCYEKYENEEEAKNCCTQIIELNDDDWIMPRKNGNPVARTHHCPNVTHGGKSWSVMLKVEEKCPMCDYRYRPR